MVAGPAFSLSEDGGDEPEILDEAGHLAVAVLVGALTEDLARVDRRRHPRREL